MSAETWFNWDELDGNVMLPEQIRIWRDRAKLAAEIAYRSHCELAKITSALGYSAGEISMDQVVEHVRNAKALADKRWSGRAEDAERALGMIAGVLIKHADDDFLVGDPTTLQVAQHIVDKLITAPEPDIETVPLQDLLEAVGTFLEQGQSITIRGSYQAVGEVDIEAMGLTFRVGTHEASEALTHAHGLSQRLFRWGGA